ncbi:MAG: hypothetical protein J6S67_07975 [Methanobrevibacter sp.]|nr:hypothetical protein [Methanobrevibacter sp.]
MPSVPKKKWDGVKPFKNACGIIESKNGILCYAVFGFSEKANSAFVKKVFGEEPILKIHEIYPVPDYMDMQDIEKWDLDEDSKKAAKNLANEALEIEGEDVKNDEPLNEWIFDEIHNIDEARAFVASYRKRKKMRGKPIKDEESLKNFLYVMWKNQKRGL